MINTRLPNAPTTPAPVSSLPCAAPCAGNGRVGRRCLRESDETGGAATRSCVSGAAIHVRDPSASLRQTSCHRIAALPSTTLLIWATASGLHWRNAAKNSARFGRYRGYAVGHANAQEDIAQFATDNPAMVRNAFATQLRLTASFANRAQRAPEQLNAVTINHAQQRRFRQKFVKLYPH